MNPPLNVVARWTDPDIAVAPIADAGARRISRGGARPRLVLATFIKRARAMHDEGLFG